MLRQEFSYMLDSSIARRRRKHTTLVKSVLLSVRNRNTDETRFKLSKCREEFSGLKQTSGEKFWSQYLPLAQSQLKSPSMARASEGEGPRQDPSQLTMTGFFICFLDAPSGW